MKNRKHLLTTSTLISLALFSSSLLTPIHASENNSIESIEINKNNINSDINNILNKLYTVKQDGYLFDLAEDIIADIEPIYNTVSKENIYIVDYILGLCNFSLYNNDESIKYFEKSLKEKGNKSNKLVFEEEIFYCLSYMYLEAGESEKSTNYYNNAKTTLEKKSNMTELARLGIYRAQDLVFCAGDSEELADVLNFVANILKTGEVDPERAALIYGNLGLCYSDGLGNNIQSIEYLIKSMDMHKQNGDINGEVSVAINIAVKYMILEDFESSVNTLLEFATNESLIAELSAEEQTFLYSTLSTALCNSGNIKDSYIYLEKSKLSASKIEDELIKKTNIAINLATEADILTSDGKGSKAIDLITQAGKIYEEIGSDFDYFLFDMFLYEEAGDAFASLNNHSKAIECYTEALNLATEFESISDQALFLRKLAHSYKSTGNIEKSLDCMLEYDILKTDAIKLSNKQYTQKLHTEYETEKKEAQISILEEETAIQKRRINAISIGTLATLSFGAYAWFNAKKISSLNKKLKALSITDGLTGVSNRRALDEFLNAQWATLNGTNTPISVIMIDIDCFKLYNDNYGHQQGDEVLRNVAQAIANSCLRKYDSSLSLDNTSSEFIARYGGEEFAIILLNTNKAGAETVAQRVKDNVASLCIPHEYTKADLDIVSLSMGIATNVPSLDLKSSDLIEQADNALYFSKENGRNKFTHFDDIKE